MRLMHTDSLGRCASRGMMGATRFAEESLKSNFRVKRHPASGGRQAAGNSSFGFKLSACGCMIPKLTLGARRGFVRSKNTKVILEPILIGQRHFGRTVERNTLRRQVLSPPALCRWLAGLATNRT